MFRKNTDTTSTQHCPELGPPSEAHTRKSSLPRNAHSSPSHALIAGQLPTGFLLCLLLPCRKVTEEGAHAVSVASPTCAGEHFHFPRLPQLHSHTLQHLLYVVTGAGQAIVLHVPASPRRRSGFREASRLRRVPTHPRLRGASSLALEKTRLLPGSLLLQNKAWKFLQKSKGLWPSKVKFKFLTRIQSKVTRPSKQNRAKLRSVSQLVLTRQ